MPLEIDETKAASKGEPGTIRRDLKRLEADWRLIGTAIEQLAGATSVRAVAAVIRRAARQVMQADGATFILREGDLCHYFDEDAVSPLWKGQRFPMTSCVSGWAMANARSVVIPDIYVDHRVPHDAYRPTFVKSLVMVPVRANQPVAAIGAYWAQEHQATETEVVMLETLAKASATALANVELIASARDGAEKLRIALEAGRLGSWELELGANRLITSRYFRERFGRGAAEIFTYDDLIGAIIPEDRSLFLGAIENATRTARDQDVECRIAAVDGTPHWIELRGRAVCGVTGRPPYMVGVLIDKSGETPAMQGEAMQKQAPQSLTEDQLAQGHRISDGFDV